MDLKEIGYKNGRCMKASQNCIQWQTTISDAELSGSTIVLVICIYTTLLTSV